MANVRICELIDISCPILLLNERESLGKPVGLKETTPLPRRRIKLYIVCAHFLDASAEIRQLT